MRIDEDRLKQIRDWYADPVRSLPHKVRTDVLALEQAVREMLAALRATRTIVAGQWAGAKMDTPQELALHSALVVIDEAINKGMSLPRPGEL